MYYFDLGVGPKFVEAVEADLSSFMTESQQLARDLHNSLTRQRAKIDGQEDRLIDLAAEGSLSKAKLQQRINSLRIERKRIEESLGNVDDELRVGAQRLLECVRLIASPARLYSEASDLLRRNLNQTFFHHFFVDDGDTIVVADSLLREPFDELQTAGNARRRAREHEKRPRPCGGGFLG